MFSIRKITSEEELNKALEIRKKVFVAGFKIPPDYEVDDYDVLPTTAHHYAILDDNEMVGTIRVILEGDDTVRFTRFAILKEHRGNGLGRYAFTELGKLYKNKNIHFHAMAYLEDFYKSMGYLTRGDYFDECGVKHIEMYKNL